jgi:hypothetical protein
VVLQDAIDAERAKTQAAIEEERAKTQALLEEKDRQATERDRQAAERERELEDRMAKMLEEERNRNMMANRALYEMFAVSFFCKLAKSCT